MTATTAVPTDWLEVELDGLCAVDGLVRGPFGGSLKKSDFVPSGFQVYEQRHAIHGALTKGRYFIDRRKFGEMERFAIRPGDLIVSCSGTIGRISLIPDNAPDGIINQALLKIRLDEARIDREFFVEQFQWPRFQARILDSTQGGAMQNLVGMPVFRRTPVLTPPLSEQRRIAAALGDVSKGIGSLERMIAKKQAVKQGMMQQLLTGSSRLPGFTGLWSSTTLGRLGAFLKGRGVRRDDVRRSGIACIRYGELYTAFTDYTAEASSFVSQDVAASALPLKTGDVLFAGSGETREEIGKCVAYMGKTPAVAGGDVIILRGEGYNPVFLALLTNTPQVVRQKSRAGQGDAVVHIYPHALAAVEVDLPPRPEQDAIAQIILEIDSEIHHLRQRLRKSRDLKQGMVQELLTGRTRLLAKEAAS